MFYFHSSSLQYWTWTTYSIFIPLIAVKDLVSLCSCTQFWSSLRLKGPWREIHLQYPHLVPPSNTNPLGTGPYRRRSGRFQWPIMTGGMSRARASKLLHKWRVAGPLSSLVPGNTPTLNLWTKQKLTMRNGGMITLCNLPFSADLELQIVVVFNDVNKSIVPKPFFLSTGRFSCDSWIICNINIHHKRVLYLLFTDKIDVLHVFAPCSDTHF